MQKNNSGLEAESNVFAPVISVLGHVDHGKTTLLDAIRKTSFASSETGGITQKIGASQIEIIHEKKARRITFIDTPGHEAFANMRSQGVSASDIALLIVASDDGVMPQTKESIQKLLEAKIPYIVVFTKSDLPNIIIDKVKQQLIKEGVLLEGYAGDVPYISVSAKTGEKIHELLELILLVYDLAQIKKNDSQDFSGVVIESKLDRKKGILVSLVVESGKLSVGDTLFINGKEQGKARALKDTLGKNIKTGNPGEALEIFGIREIIPAGIVVFNKADKKNIVQETSVPVSAIAKTFDIKSFFAEEKKDTLKVLLKTEGKGELDAIKDSLPAKVEVVFEGLGDIAVSDILMAKDFDAIIIGFNNNITKDARLLADNEHIFIKVYNIIYELLIEVQEALDDLIKQGQEVILGKGSILARFDNEKGNILGVRISEGKLALGDKVKLLRTKKEIGRSYITSLRKGKQEVKEIGHGNECGILIAPTIDFQIGDVIISYK